MKFDILSSEIALYTVLETMVTFQLALASPHRVVAGKPQPPQDLPWLKAVKWASCSLQYRTYELHGARQGTVLKGPFDR